MDDITKLNATILPITAIPITTTVSQETPPTTTQAGRCESDAIHPRLLNRKPKEAVKCVSCGQNFNSTSLDEIIEHYENVDHKEFYTACCYCGGQVHQYQYHTSEEFRNYHSCSRFKSDKKN